MLVSVIIPVYNEEKNIGECITSLIGQSYRDLEIIVVDDGSTDKTVEIIKTFCITNGSTSSPSLLHQQHRGAGAARNLGAKTAKGEILVFVDADMTFKKDFIEKLINPIQQGKTKGTFSKEEYLANKNNIWVVCWNLNRGLPRDRMHNSNYPDHQKVFRAILKSEFEKAGGFDIRGGYADDWTLAERLGYEAQAAPGALFYHQNPDSLKEVYIQSKWMGKRKYKIGVVGVVGALIRVSLPVSIILGMLSVIRYQLISFFPFKLVSDYGQFVGILEYLLKNKVSK